MAVIMTNTPLTTLRVVLIGPLDLMEQLPCFSHKYDPADTQVNGRKSIVTYQESKHNISLHIGVPIIFTVIITYFIITNN